MGSDSTNASSERHPSLQTRALVLVASVYLVAAILLTLPAWSDPANRAIGVYGDPDKFMGFLAWFPFAVTHGHNPLHMTWIDLPTGLNAMWDTTMPFASFVIWPIRAMFGIIVAYNILLVAALTLNGLCTFIWLRRHTRHQVAALLAGALMVAGPYASARAYGHLNLLLFFPIPIMFLIVERILAAPEVHRLRRGFAFGVLAAVQVLCTEEVLALAAISLLTALIIAAVLRPTDAVRRARLLVLTMLAAVVGFVIVGGVPLAYQFLGPSIPHGALQPPDVYVNDLVNFVVPTSATAISLGGPGITGSPAAPWSGNPIEWNAYVGLPMILVFTFTLFRWRHNRWILVTGLTTIAVAVLSLGPHLHVNGVDHTRFLLPEGYLQALPVVANILPNRFSLMVDFGLTAALVLFIDRVLSASERRHRVVGATVVVLIAVSLWPSAVPSSLRYTPAYFAAGGDVAKLPSGVVALVFPIPNVGDGTTVEPATWQAIADFRFKMVSGASISVTDEGTPTSGSTAQPLRCITDSLQLTGTAAPCDTPASVFLAQLRSLGVRRVIMGPTPHQDAIRAYLVSVTGSAPVTDQGVLVWTISGTGPG